MKSPRLDPPLSQSDNPILFIEVQATHKLDLKEYFSNYSVIHDLSILE